MSEIKKNNPECRQKVVDMIKALSTYYYHIREELCAPYGLSEIQSIIILDVFHNPNTKVTDICKRLNKSTNTVSPLINRLVDKGYLEKTPGKTDGRVTYISLTEKSKRITSDINVDINDYTWPMFESITDEQFKQIYDCLELLLEVTSR